MATVQVNPTFRDEVQPSVRRIGANDLDWALREGWRDFRTMRGDLLLIGVLYPLIGVIAAVFAVNANMLPLLFPLVAGLSILGPAVAAGFYELARRREEGLDSGWDHFLDPVKGRSRIQLALLTTVLAALFGAWLMAAWAIYSWTLGQLQPIGMDGFLNAVFSTREGWTMIVLGNLVGFVFAVLTLIVAVVSFPLVVDKSLSAETAVATSIRAVRANPGAVAGWGLRIAGLLVLGSLPLFVGLVVVLPVLGYATWHLYTRLVER